jgi:hypothetical protein
MNHEERQLKNALSAFHFRTRFAYRIPERNDASEMLVMTEQRGYGLTPAQRVAIVTDVYEVAARQDRF